MAEPKYRQATKDDVAAIAGVGKTVWDELGQSSGFREPMMTPEDVQARMADYGSDAAIFLCEIDGETAAFSLLEPARDEEGCAVMGA